MGHEHSYERKAGLLKCSICDWYYSMHPELDDVQTERRRQESLKAQGKFSHTCADGEIGNHQKLAILTEEVGEVARALNDNEAWKDLYKELCQVAAVCVAWMEYLNRR